MIALVTTGLASLILLGLAIALLMRAGTNPPASIRTESRRSPAEYDYQRHRASLRKRGYLCLLAGVVCVVMCGFNMLALSLTSLD